jgi:histidine ammonia-lyase
MATHSEPIYGINTGFGSLCNVKISNENLSKLQENLVKSHACGTGRSAKIVKLMLLLKIQSLGYGHSGIQLQTVNRLVAFLTMIFTCYLYTRFIRSFWRSSAVSTSILPLLGERVYFEGAKCIQA